MTAGCLTGESRETDRKQMQKGADKNTYKQALNTETLKPNVWTN